MKKRKIQSQHISFPQNDLGSLGHKVRFKILCTFPIIMLLKILINNFLITVNGILLHLGSNGHNNIILMDGINLINLSIGEGNPLGLHNFLRNNNNNNFHLPNLPHNNNYNCHPTHHQDLLSLHILIQTPIIKHFSLPV
jgi:hypothetical protein